MTMSELSKDELALLSLQEVRELSGLDRDLNLHGREYRDLKLIGECVIYTKEEMAERLERITTEAGKKSNITRVFIGELHDNVVPWARFLACVVSVDEKKMVLACCSQEAKGS